MLLQKHWNFFLQCKVNFLSILVDISGLCTVLLAAGYVSLEPPRRVQFGSVWFGFSQDWSGGGVGVVDVCAGWCIWGCRVPWRCLVLRLRSGGQPMAGCQFWLWNNRFSIVSQISMTNMFNIQILNKDVLKFSCNQSFNLLCKKFQVIILTFFVSVCEGPFKRLFWRCQSRFVGDSRHFGTPQISRSKMAC